MGSVTLLLGRSLLLGLQDAPQQQVVPREVLTFTHQVS